MSSNANSRDTVLQTEKATIRFGGLCAVNELDMTVRRGEIFGLIGPNGAGKTTIFNLLTGVYQPTSGTIYFNGQRIDGLRPYQIASRGVSRTFQNTRLFPSMTVLAPAAIALVISPAVRIPPSAIIGTPIAWPASAHSPSRPHLLFHPFRRKIPAKPSSETPPSPSPDFS